MHEEMSADVLIVGGGLGGVAGALAALRLGKRVILTEETDWLGGQLTQQAVPPDEHPWIEIAGSTNSYRRLRQGIRDYYRRHYPLRPEVRQQVLLNPGNGNVSRLCHEPRVALAVLEEMLAPYQSGRQLEVLLRHRPVACETQGDRVTAVRLLDEDTGRAVTIAAPFVLDATELGDLLELGHVEYVMGSESQAQTGEMHALPGDPDPLDQQSFTACFAMDYLPGEDHTIPKPLDYERWRTYQAPFWPGPQLGWHDVYPHTLKPRYRAVFDAGKSPNGRDVGTFWLYRRILCQDYYPEGTYPSDITLVNWPQNDYWSGPLVGVSRDEAQRHMQAGRNLSLSLMYWMQTEAPRPDGGAGYPGLRLRHDIVGTADGLAKLVYVRESRRIQAEFAVLEQHVGVEQRQGLVGAEVFPDSVGTGSYRIDLHLSTGVRNYIDISNYPFQIPLGALLPVRVENLLPACKNLGVTHITNGCYRLHPVEWNIGEAAGALAAFCLERKLAPRQVRANAGLLADFQGLLANVLGVDLAWPEYARVVPR